MDKEKKKKRGIQKEWIRKEWKRKERIEEYRKNG